MKQEYGYGLLPEVIIVNPLPIIAKHKEYPQEIQSHSKNQM